MDGQSRLEDGTFSIDSGSLSFNQDSPIFSALAHVDSSELKISSGKRLNLENDVTVPEIPGSGHASFS